MRLGETPHQGGYAEGDDGGSLFHFVGHGREILHTLLAPVEIKGEIYSEEKGKDTPWS